MKPTTSLYLDVIRFLAAMIVFVSHATSERITGGLAVIWRLGNLANDAVMMFFVLSGFVIAYVSNEKERTLREYSISRFARLYSVTVPAIALTVIVDTIGVQLSPALYGGNYYQGDNPCWRIAANLLFVNELWFTSTRPFSNGPFWSLGYEFWYYAIFAAAFFLDSIWLRRATVAAILLIVGPKILLLMPVWLVGVWVYYHIRSRAISERAGAVTAIGSLVCYIVVHQFDVPRLLVGLTEEWLGDRGLKMSRTFLTSYLIAILIALHLVGVSAVSHRLACLLPERPIRYFASFTFALYLFHAPLLLFFAAVVDHAGLSRHRAFLVTLSTLAAVWILGEATERRKSTVKRWVTFIYEAVVRSGNWCMGRLRSTDH